MKYKIETISEYYDYKRKSYNEKYNIGYYTHIHVGLYDPKNYPFLYQDDINFESLGIDGIKHLLFLGQENLTRYVCNNFCGGKTKKVLDCGCGHGGTSIYLAQNYNINVVGITISRQQVSQAKHFVRMAGLQNLVDIRLINIFDCDFTDAEFDGIIDIDSFCQMGDLESLFSVLGRILRQGGMLIISDNFANKIPSNFKARFDSYWRSDISTLQQSLVTANNVGFVIKEVKELTQNIIPFWKLSIAYSKLLLGEKRIQRDQSEQKRLMESLAFHRDLLYAFLNVDLHYYSLILEKG